MQDRGESIATADFPELPGLADLQSWPAASVPASVLNDARAGALAVPVRPKFLIGSDGILLIHREITQNSLSNYWQQGEQRIGLGLQRSRLGHLLKAGRGSFRFQPIGHAGSTG